MCDDGPWSLAVGVRLTSPHDSELLPLSEVNRLEDVPNHEHKSCVNPEHVHAWATLGSDYARSRCFRAEVDPKLTERKERTGTELQLTLSYAPGPEEDVLPRVYHLSVDVIQNSLVKLVDYRAASSIIDARSTTAGFGLSKIVEISERVANASIIATPNSRNPEHMNDQERFERISGQFHILDLPHRTVVSSMPLEKLSAHAAHEILPLYHIEDR